jgi:aminopeptidase YwaD
MLSTRTKSAIELTGKLIDRLGPRLTGSKACLESADALLGVAAGSSDTAYAEDFKVHPGAFLGFIRVMVVLYLASAPALYFAPIASAALTSVGMAILIFGFFLYRHVLDPFYPARIGRNVTAILEPTGPVKRQLIVSGHHDSAHVFRFYVDQPEKYSQRIYGGIGSFVALWVASLALTLIMPTPIVRLVTAILFTLDFVLVLPLWGFAGKEGTPGAGDNLAASAVAVELLAEFHSRRKAGDGLTGTRLVFVSFDAEEAGLRGAHAWSRTHAGLIGEFPTWHYNMDCIYRAGETRFLTSDINGSVQLSAPLARVCAEIAAEAGVQAKVEPIAFLTGGTDAAETSRMGAHATTFMAMQWSNEERSSVYHTPNDTLSAVEPEAVELAIMVGTRLAERLDNGELD